MLKPFLKPGCSKANAHPITPPRADKGKRDGPMASGMSLMATLLINPLSGRLCRGLRGQVSDLTWSHVVTGLLRLDRRGTALLALCSAPTPRIRENSHRRAILAAAYPLFVFQEQFRGPAVCQSQACGRVTHRLRGGKFSQSLAKRGAELGGESRGGGGDLLLSLYHQH
ncbi:hypothetical protein EYF80_027135 [Liparis tanakae]|uniref:Uncharacterized protein n=1 Tax=Liparis tanakae TaxID=230148 RepID=A0A4Z2HCT0_9TELE|nr:hypothetical protein EYF80_027135 [Liparis tanakae]